MRRTIGCWIPEAFCPGSRESRNIVEPTGALEFLPRASPDTKQTNRGSYNRGKKFTGC